MTDVTVTLTDHERWALDAVIVMAIEGRPIPDHWRDYVNALPAVSAKLRAAQPAAPGPLDRLEAWLGNGGGKFIHMGRRSDLGQLWVAVEHVPDAPSRRLYCSASADTLAAAVDAALKQVQEVVP